MATPGKEAEDYRPNSDTSDGSDEVDVKNKVVQRGHLQTYSDVLSPYTISSLPNELLLRIFYFLDIRSLLVCFKVSRLWESLALKPYLWRNVYIAPHLGDLPWGMIAMKCGPFMKRLRTQASLMKPKELHQLISFGYNLEIINIRFPHVSALTLRLIALNCKKLKRLHIHFAGFLTTEGIRALCKNCKSLESIELEHAQILNEDIETIARGCPLLKFIRVEGILDICHSSLGMLARSCPELQKVYLNFNRITDNHTIELASNCSGLTHLSIIYCTEITNASLFALAKHCPALEELNLSACRGLSHDGFAELARNCFHIKKLTLRGNGLITDSTISVIVDHCTSLAMLDISFCGRLTDACLICLGSCKSITHLHLCGNDQITDDGVSRLCSMQQLKLVRQKECFILSSGSVHHFSDGCLRPVLEELD